MPEPLPILSIIIVAYRSRDELPACLASLPAMLLGRPVEVCVVNNSPGDGVAAWANRDFPRVRVIEPLENLGFGRGNNRGFRETSGEFVLFLNPDTICNVAALERCVQRARDDETIGLISPRLELAGGAMDLACRRSIPTLWDGFCRATGLAAAFPRTALFSGYNLTHLPVDGTYEVGAINGAFMLGRRALLEKIAAPPPAAVFDENFFMYGDDLDLCIRVTRAGQRIVYDGSVCITHLKGVSVAKDFDRMSHAIFDANRDVYLKHFNPHDSRFVRWKYIVAFGLWKRVALLRARFRGHRRVRPV
ncbi:MAG TPA: glycosyltransferase family 2 protein, partial [Candidatus Didemnitutus sp.]|nr:glycosyltransferase family 2 protein [Candidatus Didemnitutus sp.]